MTSGSVNIEKDLNPMKEDYGLFIPACIRKCMPRRKRKAKIQEMPPKRQWNLNRIALLAILVIAAIDVYLGVHPLNWLVLALLGAYIGYGNFKEVNFLVPITAFVLISLTVGTLGGELLASFLLNLSIAFGAAGIVVSLGMMTKLIWK